MMASSLTSDAVSELILLSKGQRKPPMGYTLVGYGKYFHGQKFNAKCVEIPSIFNFLFKCVVYLYYF